MVDYKNGGHCDSVRRRNNAGRKRCGEVRNGSGDMMSLCCTQFVPYRRLSGIRSDPGLKKPLIVGFLTLVLILLVILALYLTGTFEIKKTQGLVPSNPTKPLPASSSTLHIFKRAAVCADGPPCAEIGKKILEKNGSAVDATIAAMFCNGLVNMQSMGIGGGFLMTIYSREEKKAYTLNARETAPLAAHENMFGNDQMKSRKGPLAIGVPGELKGYWEAHKKFGKLPWVEIVQPSVELCESGYILGIPQAKSVANIVNLTEPYRKWFYDEEKKKRKNYGSKVVPQELCKTLKMIAEKGPEDFYSGTLAEMVLKDLNKAGSLITKQDFLNYSVEWSAPVSIEFNNGDRLYSVPPPGSGILLGYILNILDGYNFTRESIEDFNSTVLTYHRIIEAFKYAYAKRTELGDTKFINISQLLSNLTSPQYAEQTRLKIDDFKTYNDPKHYGAVFYDNQSDNGTAHISVLSENGDAVSATSTLNLYFGSEVVSESTGITFNSVMDDFSSSNFINYFGLPGSPNNAIKPGKRPLSSMTPSIVVDRNDDVILVVGASGGTQITTGIAQVIARILWFDQNIKEAVDAPRLHHQVYPMQMGYEFGTLQQIIDGLENLGHNSSRLTSYSVICALFKKNDTIFANADHRKGGDVYGIS